MRLQASRARQQSLRLAADASRFTRHQAQRPADHGPAKAGHYRHSSFYLFPFSLKWQPNGELRPLARLAGDGHGAAVALHDGFHDRQAQAAAGLVAAARRIDFEETVEDMRQVLW